MLLVSDVYADAEEIFGLCNQARLFTLITDAIELLSNKGEIDANVGYVDICVDGECVTLPRECECVLGVNIGGHPALGHDEVFSFHLNGPGDFTTSCNFSWYNTGSFPTYRDLRCPSKLIAFLDNEEDSGKLLRVFGFDDQNRPLRTKVGDVWEDGLRVPTLFGYALPDPSAQTVGRITGIVKDRTVGNVRLSSFDNSTFTGTLLGVFEPDETVPSYRRIRINRGCDWIRLMYRKRSTKILSVNDRILLHSRTALILAMHAVKKYREYDLGAAMQFEAQATRLLTERENCVTSPTSNPIQVENRTGIVSEDID